MGSSQVTLVTIVTAQFLRSGRFKHNATVDLDEFSKRGKEFKGRVG